MAESDTTPGISSALLQLLKSRHGDRLDAEAWADVQRGVKGMAEASARLRSVALDPSDEPMTRFVPYRVEG